MKGIPTAAKAPFPLRMDLVVEQAVKAAAKQEERSINWVVNDRLKIALGLKQV